jgi:hypothetical protein
MAKKHWMLMLQVKIELCPHKVAYLQLQPNPFLQKHQVLVVVVDVCRHMYYQLSGDSPTILTSRKYV